MIHEFMYLYVHNCFLDNISIINNTSVLTIYTILVITITMLYIVHIIFELLIIYCIHLLCHVLNEMIYLSFISLLVLMPSTIHVSVFLL